MLVRSSFALVLLGAAHVAAAEPTGHAGIDVGNSYVFRGIPQERNGVVSQPYFDISLPVIATDGPLTRIDIGGATWASVHTGPTGRASTPMGPQRWYEADVTGRVTATFAGQFMVGTSYTAYTSPNASFQTVHELATSVGWADRGDSTARWLGFSPTIVLAREMGGTATGMESGTYLGISARPTINLVQGAQPVELAVPLDLGLSLGNYYDDASGDDTVGAASVGLALSTTLGFIPPRFGAWSLTLGARAHYFGPRMAAKVDGDTSLVAVNAGTTVAF